jgi:hypothetical protein
MAWPFLSKLGFEAVTDPGEVRNPYRHYTLGYGDEPVRTMERILDDLRRTLVAVMERTTREDLLAIESEESGACQHAAAHAGTEYLEHVEIVGY